MHACLSISSPELLKKTQSKFGVSDLQQKLSENIYICYVLFQHRDLCVLVSAAIRWQVGWTGFEWQ